MNMFEEVVESNWSPPEMLPALRGATMVAIDLETHDPSIKTHGAGWAYEGRGAVVGFALATPEHGSFYLPVAHGGGGNLDLGAVTRFMRELCSRPIPKIMHNSLYDTGWLRRAGIEVTGPIYDTMFAACLLDENRFSYSLDNVAKEWIGVGKDESLLDAAAKARYGAKANSKEVLWKLPANFVGRYAEVDAETTLDLFRFCKQRLEKDNLWKLFELECSLIPMLVDMRWNGIRVDVDEAGKVREMLLAKEKALLAEIKRKWRVSVDVWSAASIASAFDQEGLDYPTTDKGAASFRKGWLEAHPHELAKAVVDVRKYNKASSTFIDGMILGHTVKGRIHCELHPLKSDDGGTVSGRFCVSGDTLLETSRGILRIDEFDPIPGDMVLTHTGKYQRVLKRIYKGTERMYKVSLRGGQSITGTANHRVLTPGGWLSIHALKPGSEVLVDVPLHETCQGCADQEPSFASVHIKGEAPPGGCGEAGWGDTLHREGYCKVCSKPGGLQTGKGPSVLTVKNWGKKPNDREDGGETPQLQGGFVHQDNGLPDCEGGGILSSGTPPSLPGGHGYGRDSEGVHCSPCGRGQGEFRTRESRPDDGARASSHTRKEPVTAVDFVGEADVWDISVDVDHSYVAGGMYHHNSCSSPNLQQVPARDPEIGPLIRSLFLPEEGTVWGAFDYASQEPRLTVHFAHRAKQAGAAKAVEGYTQNPRMDYHQMVADMAGIGRKQAKGIGLGLAYSMGEVKLCHELGLPTEFDDRGREVAGADGRDLLARFHAGVPYIGGLNKEATRQASNRGYIRTYGGRLCRFDLWGPTKYGDKSAPLPHGEALAKWGPGIRREFTHKAMNRLIQGSAADMTKLAMAELWKMGVTPMMQMHDEIDVSVESKVQADLITQCMVECVKLDVPVVVDAEFGPNWGGAKYSWEQYHDR